MAAGLLFRISCGGLNWGMCVVTAWLLMEKSLHSVRCLDFVGRGQGPKYLRARGITHETREGKEGGQTDLLMLCVVIG
jgi:hypothetical protein